MIRPIEREVLPAAEPQPLQDLRMRLSEAEELLRAFNGGELDAIVRHSPAGQQVYSLKGNDHAYRTIVETMSESAITLSAAGVILYANRRFADLLAIDLDCVMGHRLQEFVDPEFALPLEELLQGSEGAATRGKIRLVRAGEVPVSVYLALRPLKIDGMLCIIAIVTDLTELERSETELNRLRNDFVSTVSHELRTPLTAITGSLGLVKSGAMGVLPEKAAAMVRIAHENSGRLMRIINDILDIGTIEAGELALQTSGEQLSDLLQQSVQVSSGYATMCEVRFVVVQNGPDPWVVADPHRLVQVIANLLSNAAKFSPAGADVFIRVFPEPGKVRVEVENSGPGVPLEFRSRLFEKFVQADPCASRRFGGTGLGLNIARKLIEAMGGCIGYRPIEGHGTVFYVEIPRLIGGPAALDPAAAERP